MTYRKKLLYPILLVLMLVSCTSKEYDKQESVFIVFKTPTFKYADLGFMYLNSDEIKIEVYGSGQALMTLEVTKSHVCLSLLECMNNDSFNAHVLSQWYPREILKNIFRARPIFKGRGLVKNRNGFTQKIEDDSKYNIHYAVFNKDIVFHDKINKIVIKMKRVGS